MNYADLGCSDNNGMNHSGLANTLTTEHEYEIDWTPDRIVWSIDGQEVRTQERAETWNATSNRFDYPQTPARVQLSLWPAGLPTNGQGTINWGGGLVDWSSNFMANNYYFSAFSEVKMECYDPPRGANVQGTISYTYDDPAGTNDTVVVGNKPTVLKSLLGSGTDMSADYPSAAASAGSAQSSEAATVPGLTGAGPGTNGQRGDNDSGGGSSNSGSGDGSNTEEAGSTGTGFVQGGGSNGSGSSGAAPQRPEKILQGSLLAVMLAVVGLLTM